ncbi:hypothetical protein QBC39DRAFT_176481 [Podospora conica]|nr:hypothetical protein QBC39DRAFT_176481 [Schizothecium conicum]
MAGESTFRPARPVRRGRVLRARQRPGPGGDFGIGPPVLNDDVSDGSDSDDEDSTSSIPPPEPTDNQALPSLGLPSRPPFLPGPVTSVTTQSTTTEIFVSTTVTFPDISTSLPSSNEESFTSSSTTETSPTSAPARPDDLPLFRETTFVTSVGPISTGSPIGATSGSYAEGAEPTEAVAGKAGIKPGAQAGIALGSIAGIALLAGLFFFLFRWIRTRRFHSAITVESRPRRHGHTRSNSTFQLAQPPPTYTPHTNTNTAQQPRDSQVLRDLLAAAHAHQNGAASDRSSTLNEKTGGAGVENAQIRHSIASWLRRHHPLKLNPMADGTGGGGGGHGAGGNMRSSFFSTFTRSNRSSVASSQPRSPGFWPRSPGLMVPSGGGAPVGAIPRSPLREVHGMPGDDVVAAEEGRGARGREGINSVWSDSDDGNVGERGHRWSRR